MLKKLLISIIILISIFSPLTAQDLTEDQMRIVELRGIISELTIQLTDSNDIIQKQITQLEKNVITIENNVITTKDNNDEIANLKDTIDKDQLEINEIRDELDDSISDLNKIKQYSIVTLVGLDTINQVYYGDILVSMRIPIIPIKIFTGISINTNFDGVLKAGISVEF